MINKGFGQIRIFIFSGPAHGLHRRDQVLQRDGGGSSGGGGVGTGKAAGEDP